MRNLRFTHYALRLNFSEEVLLEHPGIHRCVVTEGLGNLATYLAAHVLLCPAPAFFITDG